MKHPFVMLGTTKRRLTLVPDYLLCRGDRPLAVLDAKAPDEPILDSEHVEQAYSYAIHPEIRCGHFALCNGRDLNVWEVSTLKPVLQVSAREINARWDDVQKALLPEFLEKPFKRTFRLDFGIAAKMTGLHVETTALRGFHVDLLGIVDESTLTATCGANVGGIDFMASFDFPRSLLPELLVCMPLDKQREVSAALSRSPFCIAISGKIRVDVGTRLGAPTQGLHETFIPFLVTHLLSATYLPDFRYESAMDEPPEHVPRL